MGPVTEKKPEVVRDDGGGYNRDDFKPAKGVEMPEHMRDTASPRWPQNSSTEPEKHDPTAIESGRFYDADKTFLASHNASGKGSCW